MSLTQSIILVGTQIFENRVRKLLESRRFDQVARADRNGFADGIWVLWQSVRVFVQVLHVYISCWDMGKMEQTRYVQLFMKAPE